MANLGIMINKWLVPARKKAKRTLMQRVQDKLPRQMITREYSLHRWILEIFLVNFIIMTPWIYFCWDFTIRGEREFPFPSIPKNESL